MNKLWIFYTFGCGQQHLCELRETTTIVKRHKRDDKIESNNMFSLGPESRDDKNIIIVKDRCLLDVYTIS